MPAIRTLCPDSRKLRRSASSTDNKFGHLLLLRREQRAGLTRRTANSFDRGQRRLGPEATGQPLLSSLAVPRCRMSAWSPLYPVLREECSGAMRSLRKSPGKGSVQTGHSLLAWQPHCAFAFPPFVEPAVPMLRQWPGGLTAVRPARETSWYLRIADLSKFARGCQAASSRDRYYWMARNLACRSRVGVASGRSLQTR